jgi:TPR repeat protein
MTPYTSVMRAIAVALMFAVVPAGAASLSAVLAAGLAAYAAGDFAVAMHDFRALADDGSAVGETMLGTMYAHGEGVHRDPATAAAYFNRAAHRGYAPAQLAFAKVLARGEGVVADRDAAWLWLRLAIARGDAAVVAAAKAEAASLAASGTVPLDTTGDWRPWPSAGV